MGNSDSETEWKKKKKEKRDKDEDSADEWKGKRDKGGKELKEKVKEERKEKEKERKDKEKEERKEKIDKEKEERKERWDKGKEERKERIDRDKEERKERWDKEKERKDKDKEERDKEKDEKKHKEDRDKHGHHHREDEKYKLSHPSASGVDISSGPINVHDGKATSHHHITSGAPPQHAHPSQSEDVPWFLREHDIEPPHDQRPQTESNFPLHTPPPQYSFHTPPQHQPSGAVGDVGGVPSARGLPPSGYRIPLGPNVQLPALDRLGRPPAVDFDGSTPIFIGSAIFPNSVHPCRIVLSLNPPCRVLFGGSEVEHHGRYDLLPVTQQMEWVPAENGEISPGRRPVEGGYESNGDKLYHALGLIQGVYVPGKAGQHLVSPFSLFTLREF